MFNSRVCSESTLIKTCVVCHVCDRSLLFILIQVESQILQPWTAVSTWLTQIYFSFFLQKRTRDCVMPNRNFRTRSYARSPLKLVTCDNYVSKTFIEYHRDLRFAACGLVFLVSRIISICYCKFLQFYHLNH